MSDATPPPDPFTRLLRAHRDIQARAAELERVAADASAEARAAVADLLAFFEGPAALHHADEEQTLLPRLRALEGFAQMVSAFDFQHKMNDDAFAELRAAFDGGADTAARLGPLAHRFAELQRAHLLAEERALFPQAERTLSSETIAEMGREMAARRG
jgi:pyridoxamine 5'-phosphate oxidase